MPAPFQLLGSHLVLDFVNTLDDRFTAKGAKELILSYGDMLAFLEQSGVLDARQASRLRHKGKSPMARKSLQRARVLRKALASIFYDIARKATPSPKSLRCLEDCLLDAQQYRELVWGRAGAARGASAHLKWSWDRAESNLNFPAWAIAQSAIELLTSDAVHRVRECASQSCRWLFLDTSKNHSRRWCDMAICGNRMKARRFQARQH